MPCANCTCQGNTSGCTSLVAANGSSVALPGKRRSPGAEGERARLWSASPAAESGSGSKQAGKAADYGSMHGAEVTDQTRALLTTEEHTSSDAPLGKCEKHNGVRGVCCRDLKHGQDRHLIDPDIVRDVIIGLSDGLTVPFALTAGLSGVGSTRIVVLAGLAELVSGAISMGVGGLLSAQAELSHYNYMHTSTAQRVAQSCSGELEREVCAILEPFGVPEDVGALVAAKLQSVEMREFESVYSQARDTIDQSLPNPVTATQKAVSPPSPPPRRSDGLVGPERGLTPFLLRLGEGLEKVEESRVWQSALVIGASYFIGGL